MARYYTYLITSLPSLQFGSKPPFTFDGFLKRCEGLVSDEDMALLSSLENPALTCIGVNNITMKKWMSFEVMLRNELVKIRAVRLKKDPALYMREDGCPQSVYAAHIAINAHRKPSPIEAERSLDMERWQYLDELSLGHYFDIDTLILYACKLRILEKWHAAESADSLAILEEALKI